MKKFRRLVAMFLVALSIGALLPLNDVSAKSKKTDTSGSFAEGKGEYKTETTDEVEITEYRHLGSYEYNPYYKPYTSDSPLNYTFKDLVKGESFQLTVDSEEKATYTTSDKKIAKVTSKGKVTAKKEGTAVITLKVGKNTYYCGITVFKKGDKLYEWRKNAINVKDNYSLMALYGERYEYISEFYEVKGKTYDRGVTTAPLIDFLATRENLLNTGLFEEIDLNIVQYTRTGYDNNHKKVTSTRYIVENFGRAVKGIKEFKGYYQVNPCVDEIKLEGKTIYPFGVKPKKPFKSNGVTYDYIAESDGYYISCLTGAVYTEFSDKPYDSQYSSEIKAGTILPFHFRNKDAKIFATIKDVKDQTTTSTVDKNWNVVKIEEYSKEYVGFVNGTQDEVTGQATSNPTYYTNYCMEVGIGGVTGHYAPNPDTIFYNGDASKSINPILFARNLLGQFLIKQKKVKDMGKY